MHVLYVGGKQYFSKMFALATLMQMLLLVFRVQFVTFSNF
jgi:hypothetical protein